MVRVRYVIPNTLLKNNNIFGFWMYFICFFLAFFIINDNISHKEESNGYSGRILRPKTEEKKKKHEMQYFLWIIYQF